MSDPVEDDLRRVILTVYAEATGPLKSDLVYADKRVRDWDKKTIANRIFWLKQGGHLISSDRGLNDITAKGRALLACLGGHESAAPAPTARTAVTVPAAPHATSKARARPAATGAQTTVGAPHGMDRDVGQDAVRAVLQEALDAAQAALDSYVTLIADPKVLGPLRSMRDTAREALDAYVNTIPRQEASL